MYFACLDKSYLYICIYLCIFYIIIIHIMHGGFDTLRVTGLLGN